MTKVNHLNQPPIINCSLCCIFKNKESATAFERELEDYFFECFEIVVLRCGEVWVTISQTGHLECWDMSEALHKLFETISCHLGQIKEWSNIWQGTFLLDIECHKRDGYPAIIFESDIMRYLELLNAEISLDMYDE